MKIFKFVDFPWCSLWNTYGISENGCYAACSWPLDATITRQTKQSSPVQPYQDLFTVTSRHFHLYPWSFVSFSSGAKQYHDAALNPSIIRSLSSNVNLGLLLHLLTLWLTHYSVKSRETQMLTRQAVLPELIFQAVEQNVVFHFSTVIRM